MRPILITPAQHREVPWRNGRGTSFQVWPRGKVAAGAGFQLNLTPISAGGPFSHYPGVDRVLTVVQGSGLSFEGREGSMAAGDAIAFAGEAAMTAHLANGPVTVFNLLIQRARWGGAVRAGRGAFQVEPDGGGIAVVHVAAGAWRCALIDAPESPLPSGGEVVLERASTLIARPGEGLAFEPAGDDALALAVTLHRHA
jgi:environmental stress-induced protein Ves